MARRPRRRGHGEGSIYQRKDGLWCAAVTLGYDADGRQRRRYVYGKTRQEVAEKLARLLVEAQQGTLADPTRETVADFLERWLRDVAARKVRPSTLAAYRSALRGYVLPHIGQLRLGKLTPAHVQHAVAEALKATTPRGKPVSPRTVQLAFDVLRHALDTAVKWGLLARNPCDLAERPRAERPAPRVLTAEEAARLLQATEGHRLGALFTLLLTTGLRLGEALGLTWEAVDLDAGYLVVLHQLQRQGDAFRLVPPKSAAGRRRVELPQLAIEALRRHRQRQAEERARLEAVGGQWQDPFGLVFTSEVGTPLDPSNVRRALYGLLRRAGLPKVTVHGLRHTFASLALEQGAHPRTVQEVLGHSDVRLTLATYSHVAPGLHREAVLRVERAIRDGSEPR